MERKDTGAGADGDREGMGTGGIGDEGEEEATGVEGDNPIEAEEHKALTRSNPARKQRIVSKAMTAKRKSVNFGTPL